MKTLLFCYTLRIIFLVNIQLSLVLESLSLSAHPVKAKSTNTMKRKSYDSAFKQRAIKLSENLG
ncbi:MAG: hypothetical protein SNG90_08865, partial [Rikenellaceae bacterium]